MLLPTTTAILILVIMMLKLIIIIQIMPTMTVVRTIIRIEMRTIRLIPQIAAKNTNKNNTNIIILRTLILRW